MTTFAKSKRAQEGEASPPEPPVGGGGIRCDRSARTTDVCCAAMNRLAGKMGTYPKMRIGVFLQNHRVYHRTKIILRNPFAPAVR